MAGYQSQIYCRIIMFFGRGGELPGFSNPLSTAVLFYQKDTPQNLKTTLRSTKRNAKHNNFVTRTFFLYRHPRGHALPDVTLRGSTNRLPSAAPHTPLKSEDTPDVAGAAGLTAVGVHAAVIGVHAPRAAAVVLGRRPVTIIICNSRASGFA